MVYLEGVLLRIIVNKPYNELPENAEDYKRRYGDKITKNVLCSTMLYIWQFGHIFPLNPKEIKKWKIILKIGKPISKYMFVCSKHFVKDDFFSGKFDETSIYNFQFCCHLLSHSLNLFVILQYSDFNNTEKAFEKWISS